MDERLNIKYKKVLDILADVSDCANKQLVLVGGTALALFYLNHRISIDLDFVPLRGDDVQLKEMLKGCLTKKGYRTIRTVYKNQFVIQFEDTSIKIEVFSPSYKIKKPEEFEFGTSKLLVASIDDILELKLQSYADRKEARDLYDIIAILKYKKRSLIIAKKIVKKHGLPVNKEEIGKLIIHQDDYKLFEEVISNVS